MLHRPTVILPSLRRTLQHSLVAGLVALPALAWTQPLASPTEPSWQQANEWVAKFPRGHADWFKWEQARPNPSDTSPVPAPTLDLRTPDAAVATAWANHLNLSSPLNRLGAHNRALLQSGRWAEINPVLMGQIPGLDELIDIAAQTRKAWLQATASHLALAPTQRALETAQVAQELGQRMVTAGNWSPLALTPYQLAYTSAQLNWQRAQYAAAQDQAQLLKILQRPEHYGSVHWATSLPLIPEAAMTEHEFHHRLQGTQAQVHALRRDRQRIAAQLAYQAYVGSHAMATLTQNEVIKRQDFITEETQLHYNGMLKSTWDLLTEVQKQAQTRVDGINAQRDLALATLNLHLALLGEEPDSPPALGGATADTTPKRH